MFEGNPRLQEFRDKLNARGVFCRCLWSARAGTCRPPSKYDDVAAFSFIGNGFSPSVSTAIVVDYGPEHGFGLYYQAETDLIDDDVEKIAKPRE